MLTTVAYCRNAGLSIENSTASSMTASTTTMRCRPMARTMGLLAKPRFSLSCFCILAPPHFLRLLERMSENTASATMMPVMMYW